MVVVDLLRAVLADLHEEGVELRHHERDPDSEAEEYDREDHERDVKPGVPVAVAAAIVNASIPAEEEDLWGRRSGGGVRPTPSTRRYNYNVEDLAEDVGPRDRRVPVWKSDFRRPGRAARAQRHRRNPISLADFHAVAHVTMEHRGLLVPYTPLAYKRFLNGRTLHIVRGGLPRRFCLEGGTLL